MIYDVCESDISLSIHGLKLLAKSMSSCWMDADVLLVGIAIVLSHDGYLPLRKLASVERFEVVVLCSKLLHAVHLSKFSADGTLVCYRMACV